MWGFLGGSLLFNNKTVLPKLKTNIGVRNTTGPPCTPGLTLTCIKPCCVVFRSKSSRGLQRESPTKPAAWESERLQKRPRPGGIRPGQAHAGAPKPGHKTTRSPASATPQRGGDVPGWPSAALASQATTYKYLMSSFLFIRKYVNKNIL